MKKILPVLLFLIFISVQSQEQQEIQGKLLNDSITAPVHIINLTTKKGTVDNGSGEFKIQAKEGDSLLFSSMQFKNEIVEIFSGIILKEFLEIHLEEDLTELDEVNLHDFSGDLSRDISRKDYRTPADLGLPMSDKAPPTIVERKIKSLSNPLDPVGLLSGIISGEKKRLKKARQNDKLKETIEQARFLVPEQFYLNDLNLKEEEIFDFLYFCAEEPEFSSLVDQRKALELMEFYLKLKNDYQEIRDLG